MCFYLLKALLRGRVRAVIALYAPLVGTLTVDVLLLILVCFSLYACMLCYTPDMRYFSILVAFTDAAVVFVKRDKARPLGIAFIEFTFAVGILSELASIFW